MLGDVIEVNVDFDVQTISYLLNGKPLAASSQLKPFSKELLKDFNDGKLFPFASMSCTASLELLPMDQPPIYRLEACEPLKSLRLEAPTQIFSKWLEIPIIAPQPYYTLEIDIPKQGFFYNGQIGTGRVTLHDRKKLQKKGDILDISLQMTAEETYSCHPDPEKTLVGKDFLLFDSLCLWSREDEDYNPHAVASLFHLCSKIVMASKSHLRNIGKLPEDIRSRLLRKQDVWPFSFQIPAHFPASSSFAGGSVSLKYFFQVATIGTTKYFHPNLVHARTEIAVKCFFPQLLAPLKELSELPAELTQTVAARYTHRVPAPFESHLTVNMNC
jgi:hypothetical protein